MYWRLIGPFSGLIRWLTLRLVKSDAEKQPGTKGRDDMKRTKP
jgi:hypothetical protein